MARGGDEIDGARLGCDVGEHLKRVRTGSIVGEVMFDRPDVVEAHGLGLDGELGLLHEALHIRNPVEVLIAQVHAYLHWFLQCGGWRKRRKDAHQVV